MLKVNVEKFKNAVSQSLGNNVLLKASNNVLNVCSSNYETYEEIYSSYAYHNTYENLLSISINAENDNDFTVLINKADLLDVLRSVGSEYVNLSMQRNSLVISDGKIKCKLKSQDPDLFVDKNLYKDIDSGIALNSKDLINAIDRVAFATDNSSPNYSIFKTIGFIFENNSFFISAVGGNCLAVCDLKVPNNLNGRFGITKTAALTLKEIFKDKQDILFNIVDDDEYKIAVFKSDNIVFTTKIVKEDVYPDVLNAINNLKNHSSIELKLSKDAIINTLQSFISSIEEKKYSTDLSIFNITRGDYYNAKLTLSNNNLNISSAYYDSQVDIPIDYKGDEYSITFKSIDLLEAVKNAYDNNITLKLPPKNEYPTYVDTSKSDYLVMVFPVRVR